MRTRGVTEDLVARAIFAPERVENRRPGRIVVQTRVELGLPPRPYIVRVILDVSRRPPEVVTAYLTSKLAKYGSGPP